MGLGVFCGMRSSAIVARTAEVGFRMTEVRYGGVPVPHAAPPAPPAPSLARRAARLLRTSLFAQVACALLLGVLVGRLWPEAAAAAQPLGDGFVRLIKAMIAPLVFCVVVAADHEGG